MIEIGKIFINDKNGIEIIMEHEEICKDIYATDSEGVLDRMAEIICIELNEIKEKADKCCIGG